MNVNETIPDSAVSLCKIEPTDLAFGAMDLDTVPTIIWVTLIPADDNGDFAPPSSLWPIPSSDGRINMCCLNRRASGLGLEARNS